MGRIATTALFVLTVALPAHAKHNKHEKHNAAQENTKRQQTKTGIE